MRIVVMAFTAILTVVLPLGLMLRYRRKGGTWSSFFTGVGVFILFALILEQLFHALVLFSPLGGTIQNTLWLYALYGGLAAGLFEETGRFVAFRFFLRKQKEPVTALAYGAGHGGVEAVLIVGLTMVNNIVLLAVANSGAPLEPSMAAAVETLAATPAGMFLWSAFERVVAIILHIALSVLVFASVREAKKHGLFVAAVLIHAGVDALAVVLGGSMPVAVMELAVLAVTVLTALFAAKVYRGLKPADPT